MTDKPNATLTDNQVWDILGRLHKISLDNADGDTQMRIASDYGVEKKTISRINTGKTWRTLKQRFDEQASSSIHWDSTVQELLQTEDMIADLGGAKQSFGLDIEQPLHFGRYDWYDGVHWVATDGTILWEFRSLYDLAVRAESSGVKGYPVFASKACELPTFKLSDIMTRPIGDRFYRDLTFTTGEVKLISEEGHEVFIHSRYMDIIERMKLDMHVAGSTYEFIYLTKTKVTRHTEDTVIFAAVTTMEN